MGTALFDFFSSPIGLGHATRDAAIAQSLGGGARAASGEGAGAPVLARFVTGGGAARILRNLGFGVSDLYGRCPPFAVRDGSLRNPGRWLCGYYRYYQGCRAVSRDVLGADRPDLVVSDEDFASLSVAQGMGIPTVLITDILQTRFTGGVASLAERLMNRAMRRIIKKCDRVILPEDGDDGGNVRRVGPIVRRTTLSRADLRRGFGLDRRTVTVSVGGTAAGSFLIGRSLEAISRIDEDLDVVIVTGPAARAGVGLGRGHRGRDNHRIRNLGFIDNLHELIFASDALVSLAGRSTMDEAAAYGTPAVFIPIRGHFEQEDNAGRQGFAFGDVDRLGDLIPGMLRQQRRHPAPADGADRASEIIREIAAAGAGRRPPRR